MLLNKKLSDVLVPFSKHIYSHAVNRLDCANPQNGKTPVK